MDILDLHAHILPGVDDGAKDTEESIALLNMLKSQGITHVVATPHFLANRDSIEEFKERINAAKETLFGEIKGMDLPKIIIGCEVLYQSGMGSMQGIRELTINGSDYILIEFDGIEFSKTVCKDIARIRENMDMVPIIAHIERYKKFKGYDNLLELVEMGVCKSQVNSSSVVDNVFTKNTHKLIKKGLVNYIASDTHSVNYRPPVIDKAYAVITEKFGKQTTDRLIKNGERLLERIK